MVFTAFDLQVLTSPLASLQPETPEEVAIWEELTKPSNYRAIVRYAEEHKGHSNDHYVKILGLIRESARRHFVAAGGAERKV